jgi:hypothetical protein
MLDVPSSLPNIRKGLEFQVGILNDWKRDFRKHPFTDDVRLFVDSLHYCHLAAMACIDDNIDEANKSIARAIKAADAWLRAPSGRNVRENWIDDYYGGIHSDNFNGQGDAAIHIAEDLCDWEFVSVSARATNEYKGETFDFDGEQAALLTRIRALRACSEAVIPCCMEQKLVTQQKMRVAQYEIAAWAALIQEI